MKRLAILALSGAFLVLLGWHASRQPANPYRLAEQAYLRGDYLEALQFYSYASPHGTDPGRQAFNRAAASYQLGLLDQATEGFETALGTDDPNRTARASYELGNCALRSACQSAGKARDRGLHTAIAHYDTCMRQTGDQDPDLLENAWHNQKLARSLLSQSPSEQMPSVADRQPECEL
jgi:tetratricopeptide (TPR) repeat protein